jgi:uroporphyrinogen-III synthase
MPTLALAGRHVLVTRPAHQAEGLCALIEQAGGIPVRFPVLAIADPVDTAALDDLLDRLADFHLAVFISPNAVQRAMPRIHAHGGLPDGILVAAVGKGSARELARYGRATDLVPSGRFNSEALLEMPELGDLASQRVVVFRGEGGRELLADVLRERGAQVEYAEVYRRVKPEPDTATLLRRWAHDGMDVAVVTSNEALRNLYDMVGSLGRQWLRKTPLVVVSERAVALARDLGLTAPVMVAARPDDEGLRDALLHWAEGAPASP